ncbi:hypothetical protein NM208_g8816 [Fusarium decemcellulare]|uniref:Uncharacterized protein n=1 Tax=Fusarium decemcellulare TaxID=57161 RepID=A0ACC1S3Y9_9HYPO|nr:hypothetical protein NM208_g8816 [Fusarium decemcellulare]
MSGQRSPTQGHRPPFTGEDWLSWLDEHDNRPGETTSLDDVPFASPDARALETRDSSVSLTHHQIEGGNALPVYNEIPGSGIHPTQSEPMLQNDVQYSQLPSGHSGSFNLLGDFPVESELPYGEDTSCNSQSAFGGDYGAPSDSSCTFCTDAFKTKHDWQRHETTMHLSLEQWKCARFGPVIQLPEGHFSCVFCDHLDPSTEHPELHNYSACAAQPDEARMFHRKDHLRQHLRLFHRGCTFKDSMKSWLSSVDNVKSRCGFCDARMDTWAERQKHLAVHFRNGADIREWKGDRGFDQQIDDLVENDMPVFLIGDQRQTMEPFSASRVDHRTEALDLSGIGPFSSDEASPGVVRPSSNQLEAPHITHSYRNTERLLLKYVSEEIAQGRVPSDRLLQKRMSEIMYGPDNAWDPTWADNPQWLDMFRKKAGLISLPLSGGKNAFVGYDAV